MTDGPARTMRDPDKRGRHSTAIRFDPDVYDRLVAESEARMASINWVVNRLVAEGLDRIIPVEDMRLTAAPRDHQNPKKDQTIDPDETWVSHHHLSRCPEEPGQHIGGPAAAAETQPCSTGEARSNRDGRGGAPGAVPTHPAPTDKTTAEPGATGRRS